MADMNQPGGGEPAGGQGAAPGDSPGDIRNWCMGAHLSGLVGFIGPLIVWLIKKDS